MKTRYYLLVLLAIVFTIIYFFAFYFQVDWLESFSSNLATGFLGSFLTVLFIDRALERERREETRKVQSIALRQLRPALMRHLKMLSDWYKAASLGKPDILPGNISEIFNDNFYEQVRMLDFSKDAPIYPKMNWFIYSSKESKLFINPISRTIEKYAVFLEPIALEMLEDLENSVFVNMVVQISDIPALDQQLGYARSYNILYDETIINHLRQYISTLISFLEYYNSFVQNPIHVQDLELWRNDVAPLLGSSRANNPSSSRFTMGTEFPR